MNQIGDLKAFAERCEGEYGIENVERFTGGTPCDFTSLTYWKMFPICEACTETVQIKKRVWDFPTSILQRKIAAVYTAALLAIVVLGMECAYIISLFSETLLILNCQIIL